MRILLLAGEPSGDRHAAAVARALRRLEPSVELVAMGSDELAAAGAELVVDSSELAVVGLTEVLGSLGALLAARRTLREEIDRRPPSVVVPVDYPDFNLRIARHARRRGVPVAYFVSPQVWAWRSGRVPSIGRAVSRMLTVFPFESEVYERHGVPVEHVGHPLLDEAEPVPSRDTARRRLGIGLEERVVALLPGSRRKEVHHVWPVLVDAARRLVERKGELRFVVPLAPGLRSELLEEVAPSRALDMLVVASGFDDVVAACDVAAVASGTATLQVALAGRPLVVGYRVSALTYALSRRLADAAFLERGLFSLPNLVLGRRVVPELYQHRFRGDEVAAELARLLDSETARALQRKGLASLRDALGGPGCAERVARAALSLAREGSREA